MNEPLFIVACLLAIICLIDWLAHAWRMRR